MGESLNQTQDDPSSENISLAAGLGVHEAFEFSLLAGSDFNRYSVAQPVFLGLREDKDAKEVVREKVS